MAEVLGHRRQGGKRLSIDDSINDGESLARDENGMRGNV